MSGAKSKRNKPLSKRRGDCAEYLAEKKMEDKGYEPVMIGDEKATDVLTNKSGHGLDHLMTDKDGFLVVGETKANSAQLSKLQKKGAVKYLKKQLIDMKKGLGGDGRYKNLSKKSKQEKKAIRKRLNKMQQALGTGKVRGEVHRVPLKSDKGKNAYTPKEDKNRCNVATDKEIKTKDWWEVTS